MPRSARIKPQDTDAYYHLTNRIAGVAGEYPFGDVERQKMISLIKDISEFSTVQVLGFVAMGNHFHIVCYAPAELLSAAATAERYNRYYTGRKPPLSPEDPRCATVAEQMRDISVFMGRLQQRFSTWYNRTRPVPRRGSLWAERFGSVLLERDTALWRCLCYVEMNPVRARLVADPADYRFGSWGEWSATGKHPFADNLRRQLVAYEGDRVRARSLPEIQRRFRVEFARVQALETGAVGEQIDAAMQDAAETPAFLLRLDRRIRYWSAGVIIGSRTFVLENAARFRDPERVRRKRLQQAEGNAPAEGLFAYRQLRALRY